MYDLDDDSLTEMRSKHIVWVFQSFGLIDNLTALENIIIPLNLAGVYNQEAETRANELLILVGLEDRAGYFPDGFCGGQPEDYGYFLIDCRFFCSLTTLDLNLINLDNNWTLNDFIVKIN